MFHRSIVKKADGFVRSCYKCNNSVPSARRSFTLGLSSHRISTGIRSFSSIPNQTLALKLVKEQGLEVLQSVTTEIQSKTKRRLLLTDEDTGPSQEQIQEAARLRELVEDAIDTFTMRRGSLFCIMDEPISIIDVEVSEDLRHARVYWSLPFSVLLMDNVSMEVRMKVIKKMQNILETKGGPIQGIVHQKLRHYHRPPTIKWVQAEGEMIRSMLKELL